MRTAGPKCRTKFCQKVRALRVDDVYEALRAKGYPNQFAGGFEILRPGVKLVGRALTAQYLPLRPGPRRVTDRFCRPARRRQPNHQQIHRPVAGG